MLLTIDTENKEILHGGYDEKDVQHFARLHELEGYTIHEVKPLSVRIFDKDKPIENNPIADLWLTPKQTDVNIIDDSLSREYTLTNKQIF